jgi:prepilin-type N-terminal cleavage/methylation domain-containing protein
MTRKPGRSRGTLQLANTHGFSLLELLVAMAVFLIVSGASFMLFQRHQALLSQEQGLTGLNIGLRNALTQIQADVVNAGNGLVVGAYVPAWPVGVTINNPAPSTPCNNASTFTYTSTCFDKLYVILADQQTPTCYPQATINTSSTNTLNAVPTAGSASAYYHNFKNGDTVLLVKASGTPFTTLTLTADAPTPSGSSIVLNFTPTSAVIHDPGDGHITDNGGINTHDNFLITTYAPSNERGVSYGSSDWLIRLAPITYWVDTTTDPNNPKLMRQVAGGNADIVMEQVVSFRVGAALVNDNSANYYYKASAATNALGGYASDFTQVRSVRVSLMGRTKPDAANPYRNQFDYGPYRVLGSSIVVNPRNLSMNDQ